jgi:putative oxidoreductase
MKIAVTIARILLGLLFTVFGLNGFLHFLKMPPPTGQLAGQYMGALFLSHYLVVVFLVQVIGGVLLLVNRYVPLALVLLGPVVVNIVLFHSTMAQEGLPMALVATVLWLVVFAGVRKAFAGIFEAKTPIA